MTAPTRRNVIAGSLAALGAAGAPAIAESKEPSREKPDLLKHLPFELQALAFFKWLKTQPVAYREEVMADLAARDILDAKGLAFMREFVDLPAA